MHYTCIACITVDSVMRMDKKNYPQVYLEECKYKIYQHWTRFRFGFRLRVGFRVRWWINSKIKIWFW